jgi:nitroreductase
MNILRIIYQKIPEPVRRLRHDVLAWVKKLYLLVMNGAHDVYRMGRYSSALKSRGNREHQKAKLTYYYHKIEKAMALPMPKPGFGKDWIAAEFIPLLKKYYSSFGNDDVVGSCYINLSSYIIFNKKLKAPLISVYKLIEETLRAIEIPSPNNVGGTKEVLAEEIKTAASINFSSFVNSRYSIRNFTSVAVECDIIEKAIQMAQRTPSVCNRQPWHVYAFNDKQQILEALKHQNGNAGFSQNIQVLLVVAGDLSSMMSSSERNEIWVDGGMFSMSIVYSLHSLGVGTCCLNLCHNVTEETRLRRQINMDPFHSPVMMIAVGHIPQKLAVAHSQRKSVNEVLTWSKI